jgi:hypothetical protein
MNKEEYPKLIARGVDRNEKVIYLIEDEELFYGYNREGYIRASHVDIQAVRWCFCLTYPEGSENVQELYKEALQKIESEAEYRRRRDCSLAASRDKRVGKRRTIDMKEEAARTQADKELSKHFL